MHSVDNEKVLIFFQNRNTVSAVLEIHDFISKQKKVKDYKGELAFEMRVVIHTGAVVASIVIVKKIQYNIWDDTVNTTSRIENKGEVNFSQSTYELITNGCDFSFESRGKIEAEGKGDMEMHFVNLKV